MLSLKLAPTHTSLLAETGKASRILEGERRKGGSQYVCVVWRWVGGGDKKNDNKKRGRLHVIGDTVGVDRALG